jgi:flagellar basal body-associated protein FliL
MFWPWKFGISLAAAGLITAITADLTREAGVRRRRVWVLGGLLVVTVILAGAVTYYYHLNEPTDDDEDSDQPAQVTSLLLHR